MARKKKDVIIAIVIAVVCLLVGMDFLLASHRGKEAALLEINREKEAELRKRERFEEHALNVQSYIAVECLEAKRRGYDYKKCEKQLWEEAIEFLCDSRPRTCQETKSNIEKWRAQW